MKTFLLPMIFLIPFFIKAQQSVEDSLNNLLKKLPVSKNISVADTTRLSLLTQLSTECDMEKISTYTRPGLKLAEEMLNREDLSKNPDIRKIILINKATLLGNEGYMYRMTGDIFNSLKKLLEGHEIQKQFDDPDNLAALEVNIGGIYQNIGDTKNALEYYFNSLKGFEKANDAQGTAQSLNNIGRLYEEQGDLENAKANFEKGLKLALDKKDIILAAGIQTNLGNLLMSIKKYPEARQYFDASLENYTKADNRFGIAQVYGSLGKLMLLKNDYAASLNYYEQNLKIYEEIGVKDALGITYRNLGDINTDLNKNAEAEKYYRKALALGKELGFPRLIRDASEDLSNFLKKQKRFEEALTMYALYKQMSDSVGNVEMRKSAVREQMQYDFDKQSEQRALEQQKKDLESAEEKRIQRIVLYVVSAGLLLVLSFAIIAFRNFRAKQKANIEISKQKELLEEKQKEIYDSLRYARRIQSSLMTSDRNVSAMLKKASRKKE